MTDRNVICISFRRNEMWLFDKLKTFSCPSGTIKDILKDYFKDNTNKPSICADTNSLTSNNNCSLNLMDF